MHCQILAGNRIFRPVFCVVLVLSVSQLFAVVGATTPFTTYEAESGVLGGGAAVVTLGSAPTTEFSSPALEASGHAYVILDGQGQNVTWTNSTSGSVSGY